MTELEIFVNALRKSLAGMWGMEMAVSALDRAWAEVEAAREAEAQADEERSR